LNLRIITCCGAGDDDALSEDGVLDFLARVPGITPADLSTLRIYLSAQERRKAS
jgi:hypothetical protein